MDELKALIAEGVTFADGIRSKYNNDFEALAEVTEFTKKYIEEKHITQLVGNLIEKNPSSKSELLKRFMAFYCEGKTYEKSMI
jgi:hypothetical protein